MAALALAALGVLAMLALLEAALRTYDAFKTRPPEPRGDFWLLKKGFGRWHDPGVEAPWYDDHGEYSVRVRINLLGLRDVERGHAKPPGVFRILLLGDSLVEGMQVELEEIFAQRLEAALAREGRRVEVVNASVAEWGTDNELVFFREEGRRYSPDLVLLAFATSSDVRENSAVLNLRVPNPNAYKPTFSLMPDGTLQEHAMPEPPEWPPPDPWWQALRAAVFFSNRFGFPVAPPLPPPPPQPSLPTPAPPSTSKVFTDMLVYQSPPNADVAEAWRITKALVRQLESEVRREGAGFAMFLVDGAWAHVDDYWNLMTMNDLEARRSWSRRTPNDTMMRFAAETGMTVLDLHDEFEAKKSAAPLYFRRDPHWTPAGHRVAADAVARFLVERGLVPAPGAAGP